MTVQELEWSEETLKQIDFPKETLRVSAGFGSGLTARPGGNGHEVWAISDRGPNIKLDEAKDRYGWKAASKLKETRDAKLMPCLDIGPAIGLLTITATSVALKRTIRLRDSVGDQVSGLPVPESGHAECEPAYDLSGHGIDPDPSGLDTEGIVALEDGTFWASEEYGPSLVRISADGEIIERLVPEGVKLTAAKYPVRASLPAIAAKRHLNRGFEAIAASPSNRRLFVAFQSPLAHPTRAEHEQANHIRLWQLDAGGCPVKQYLYRLDDPSTYQRDAKEKSVHPSDRKVCEIAALDEQSLLILERVSETCKIYVVQPDDKRVLQDEHWLIGTTPTVEQLSRSDSSLPELAKQLVFNSDDYPEVGPDIEGMTLLDPRTLLIVSDNDFGCGGKKTRFFKLHFRDRLTGASA